MTTEFVYGNVLTGEMRKTKKHMLILDPEPLYTKFLQKVLKRYEVKSPHPIVAFIAGDKVVVISGEGLTSNKHKAIPVDEELDKVLQKIHELSNRISELTNRLYEEFFEDV